MDDLEGWKQTIRPNTRILFIETPSNPLAQVGDMQIADIAHAHGALFAVDNCFCTPVLQQQPIKFGADLVLLFSN